MLRFAVDEDFDNRIVRGLLRLLPTLDIVRAQDAGLLGKRDPEVLEWAASENRVLLTHDATSMTKHAYAQNWAIGIGKFENSDALTDSSARCYVQLSPIAAGVAKLAYAADSKSAGT